MPPTYSGTPFPGSVATNSLMPDGTQYMDAATWQYAVGTKLKNSILAEVRRSGTTATVGMPASWTLGGITEFDVLNGNKLSPGLEARINTYVASQAAANDADFVDWAGEGPRPATTGREYILPLSPAEELALRKQDFAEATWAIELALKQSASKSSSLSGSRSSGGGSGSAGDPFAAAKLALQEQLGMGELDIKRLQLAADTAYKEALIRQQELDRAESGRQFDKSFGLQEQQNAVSTYKALSDAQSERAGKIAALGANPGDAVQREYFLRAGAEPVGTEIDAFTGMAGSGAGMKLSELMNKQKDLLRPYVTSSLTGAQPPTAPVAPGNPEADPEDVPAMAIGGYTRAPRFIAGDSPAKNPFEGGARPEIIENPTRAPIRVRNSGQTLSAMLGKRTPRYAYGTLDAPLDMSQVVLDPISGAYQTMDWMAENRGPSVPTVDLHNGVWQVVGEGITTPDNAGYKSGGWTTRAGGDPRLHALIAGEWYDAEGNVQRNSPVMTDKGAWWGIGSAPMNVQVATPPAGAATAPTAPTNPATPPTSPAASAPGGTAPATAPGATAGEGIPTSSLTVGWNSVTTPGPTAYSEWADPSRVFVVDPATGQQRPIQPGETVSGPVWIDNRDGALNSGPATPAPAPAVTAPPPVAPDTSPGGSAPTVTEPAMPGAQVAVGPANQYGYSQVTSGGTAKTADGGGTYQLEGDGTEFRDKDGNYWKWNAVAKTYLPVLPTPTVISAEAQFWALPEDVRNKILSGQATGYVLNNAGINTQFVDKQVLAHMNSWVSAFVKVAGRQPTQQEYSAEAARYRENDLLKGLDPNRIYPSGWVSGVTDPFRGTHRGRVTDAEFAAMSPEEQAKAVFEGLPSVGGVASRGSAPEFAWTGNATGRYTLPTEQVGGRRFYTNVTPELKAALWPYYTPSPAPETYAGGHGNLGGTILEDRRFAPANFAGAFPQNPAGSEEDDAVSPTAAPDTGTTTTGSTTGGTTTTTTGGSTTGGTAIPPTGTAGTGNALLDQLLGLNADNPSVLSYGNDVWQNIPALRFLRGEIPTAEYETVAAQPTQVPALGVTLPAPNSLNYTLLEYLAKSDPEAFAAMESIWKAGNRSLAAEMAIAKTRAPLGTAYETSLVST